MQEEEIRRQLEKQVSDYNFIDFEKERQKGRIYCVDEELELVEMAILLVLGKGPSIEKYIEDGLLFLPSKEEGEAWAKQKHVKFSGIKIIPYTLIQKSTDSSS